TRKPHGFGAFSGHLRGFQGGTAFAKQFHVQTHLEPHEMKKTLLAVTLAALTSGAASTVLAADSKAPAPDFSVSANVGVFSDYRFRGISQTDRKPAIQGGFDISHKSGAYVGNWNSNVSGFGTAPSGNVEMDLYAGYKFEFSGLSFDVGTIYYFYPGSIAFATGAPKVDTHEIYAGIGYGPVSLKISNTLSKGYFGIGQNFSSDFANQGSAKGTLYYDLTVSSEVASNTVLTAHVGYLDLDGQTSAKPFEVTDYRVGIAYDAGFATLGLNYVGNDINANAKGWFTATPTGRGSVKNYTDTVVISLSKTF
ncbi:MAG: hypothetical protein RJA17_783, partial [Pseudomonadota bacterium]